MVMEGIAQVTGDGVQFMIGQVRPDAAGNLDSAGIGRLGLFQVVRLQQAAQDPRIEDGIVGDQDASFQMRRMRSTGHRTSVYGRPGPA